MKNLLEIFRKNDIGEPPWEYDFLVNLPESEYPKYLAKIFNYRTGEKLPLKFDFKQQAWVIDKKRCKTFNQKIQWIKLYGVTDLMRKCTDKVAVRDYVKEKIGEEYLKPVLQICDSFDEIDFDEFPNAFVIKCSHGSKWQYIIKNKENYLSNIRLIEVTKNQITGWLEQEFFPWEGFEMQYKTVISPHSNHPPQSSRENNYNYSIVPKILIETLLRENININCPEILVYCFNGKPKHIVKLFNNHLKEISIYDENLCVTENLFLGEEMVTNNPADENIKIAVELSKELSKCFCFVRIDWLLYKDKLYFEELTFTPYSGFNIFSKKDNNLKLGNWLNLERLQA